MKAADHLQFSRWTRAWVVYFSIVGALLCQPARSHDETGTPSKAETTIYYRQGVYKVIGWNMSTLGQMIKGTQPFDAKIFARDSARIAQMAPMLLEGFTPDSAHGAKTDAKPEIWSHFDDFTQRMQLFEHKSAALAAVAQSEDPGKIKPAFIELANSCKACHDKYHAK